MKLLMFEHGGHARLGALRPGAEAEVVDLAAAGGGSLPPDVLGVIDGAEAALTRVRELASGAAAPVLALEGLTLLPPLDGRRGNIIAVGRNYQKHAEEGALAMGTEVGPPTIFTKAVTTITGPHSEITIDPRISEQIDWEVELGVVIGRSGANIKAADALAHVFGYTALNDVSARDIQNGWGGQWFKGKSLDASCPVGPWVVTADEIPDPQVLDLSLRVNGELKQAANSRDMIHSVAAIIEWASKGMTLLPGALIATGTPEGVGFARTPPEFLRPGDVMETEVSGIGVLRNHMVAAAVAAGG
ncbi:MAG: fumarylacetoacetate hydrolase family protein [Candidatus Dormibacteraeota bacterium]|nr:fumarylacetoacetate hydrolase family protein [Candidatus Dormibacteraeota bacterium]